jgi:hypothetical protein
VAVLNVFVGVKSFCSYKNIHDIHTLNQRKSTNQQNHKPEQKHVHDNSIITRLHKSKAEHYSRAAVSFITTTYTPDDGKLGQSM